MTTTLTARRPEDLLAAVPVVLGFRPQDSLVMLTFDAPRSFHARVDLPPPAELDDSVSDLVDALLEPCLAQGVGRVAFVFYSADASLAARAAAPLRRAFTARQIGVVDVLRADRGCWSRVPRKAGKREQQSCPYDDEAHPFSAQAVFEGRVTLRSREALRETLEPLPDRQQEVAAAVQGLDLPGPADVGWLGDLVGRCVDSGDDPDTPEAARALLAVTRIDARDAALYAVSRSSAHLHLRVWTALLRRAPDSLTPEVAAIVAFCAWQAGHGALAWCALDRCLAVAPEHRLAACLTECLTHAVPPTAWDEVADSTTGVSDTA